MRQLGVVELGSESESERRKEKGKMVRNDVAAACRLIGHRR